MAIEPIKMVVSRKNRLTQLHGMNGSLSIMAGSQFDDNAHSLEFARDPEYANDTLVLYFDDVREPIGRSNTFVIPAALTQNPKINLQVAFIRDGDELEHSNIVSLLFRDSLDGTETLPPPMPDLWMERFAAAIRASEDAQESAGNASNSEESARESSDIAVAAAKEAKSSATGVQEHASEAKSARDEAVDAKKESKTILEQSLEAQSKTESAQKSAQTAQAGAETAMQESKLARTGSETARSESESARDGAKTALSGAQMAQKDADTSRIGAEAAKKEAQTAQSGAQAARTDAETARNETQTALSGAKSAEAGAKTARTGAETAEAKSKTAQTASESAMAESVAAKNVSVTSKNEAQTAMENAKIAQTGAETARDETESMVVNASASPWRFYADGRSVTVRPAAGSTVSVTPSATASGTINGAAVAFVADVPYTFVAQMGANTVTIASGTVFVRFNRDSMDVLDQLTSPVTDTGPIATINGVINGLPLDITARSIATQNGTGCLSPIVGLDIINVWRGGKNLLDDQRMMYWFDWNGQEWISITNVHTNNRIPLNVPSGESYTLSMQVLSPIGSNVRGVIHYTDGTQLPTMPYVSTGSYVYQTAKSDPTKSIKEIGLTYSNNVGTAGNVKLKEFQLELGSIATLYEPYNGNTYTITPQQSLIIPALSGLNQVYTDAGGDTTVTGRMGAQWFSSRLELLEMAMKNLIGVVTDDQ